MPLGADRFALCADCDAKVGSEAADRERRDLEARITSDLVRSGLPRAYRDGERTIADVVVNVGKFAALFDSIGFGRGLFLHGPAGTYKTSVAAALLAEQVRAGNGGRYVFVPTLFAELFAIYAAHDGRSSADVIERYASTRHLVLDDLGKERATEHAASVVMQILDARYADPRGWLIVTSNYSLDELRLRFDAAAGEAFADPIVRRISELCVPVAMERAA